jgi:hypothetical protein
MGRHWSDEPRHFTIDLTGATTPERLRAALAKHFDLAPDIREISCAISLPRQECPYRISFLHWAEFEQRMPKYARRLKHTLEEYVRWHPHALFVEYGAGAPAPVKSVPPPGNWWVQNPLGSQPESVPDEEPFPAPSRNNVYQRLNCIVLEPLAKPTVEQIRAVRELSLGGRDYNMLEMRRILVCGGLACFGVLFDDRAKEISSRLSAIEIPHRIEKTDQVRGRWVTAKGEGAFVATESGGTDGKSEPCRHIVFWKAEGK